MATPLHVAFVASEMVPFMKTGGLGDVGAALPKALGRLGHRVTVFLPRYAPIAFPPGEFRGLGARAGGRRAPQRRLLPPRAGAERRGRVRRAPAVLRPARTPYGAGNRDYEDNRLRFAFLSRARPSSTSAAAASGRDVFHAHDWQTGLVPVYLKSFYWDDPTLHRIAHASSRSTTSPTRATSPADTPTVLGLPWNLAPATRSSSTAASAT